jgi:UDP-2,3-diacylglucosamine pyrophosphatase LpxH
VLLAEPTRLDPNLRVSLVSDLHIGDGGPTEPFASKDDLLRDYLERVAAKADALVVLGDGFDLAQAWTLERIWRAHRPLLEDLQALATSMPIYYVQGNHEGEPDELVSAFPFRFVQELTIGDDVIVTHGNIFDPHNLPGDRRAFWGSRIHAMLERAIRSRVRIPMRKHHCWSTRVGHWMFYRYGQLRMGRARMHEVLGDAHRAKRHREFLDYWGRGEWGDNAGLLEAADGFLRTTEARTLVCGHSHQPGVVELDGGTYVNTGSWTYEEATHASYEDGRFVVRDWPSGRTIADEEYRAVLGQHGGKSFFDWWEKFYLGWFRYDLEGMHALLDERPE